MPRRTQRRRAALLLAATATAVAAPTPAHALTLSPSVSGPEFELPASRLVLAAARDHVGAAYAMGASGPGAFDCSGLTSAAFHAAGIDLPRTSQAQFAMGRKVARDDVRAGDLVFFSTAGPGASHVGIATSNDTAISATSSGGVMRHSTKDAYWGGSYVGARRVS
jgi:cell wall-associated NlpC family hydrolase